MFVSLTLLLKAEVLPADDLTVTGEHVVDQQVGPVVPASGKSRWLTSDKGRALRSSCQGGERNVTMGKSWGIQSVEC